MDLRTATRFVIATLLATSLVSSWAAKPAFLTGEQRAEDFAIFCRFVKEEYAYFDLKKADWERVCKFYAPRAESATDESAYIEVLERALGELYDAHAHLGTNTSRSYRLVPTQAELVATWSRGRAVVSRVRRSSGAERAGLLPGMEVVAINGEPVGDGGSFHRAQIPVARRPGGARVGTTGCTGRAARP